jgi:hypothetical protein
MKQPFPPNTYYTSPPMQVVSVTDSAKTTLHWSPSFSMAHWPSVHIGSMTGEGEGGGRYKCKMSLFNTYGLFLFFSCFIF